ncbi:MAG: phosphatase PAP2-related protein [Parcubacteria group bacterium]
MHNIKNIFLKHRNLWKNKEFLNSVSTSFLFVATSLLLNHFTSIYATGRAGNAVEDIFLSNLPVFNVDLIVNEGTLAFVFFVAWMLFLEPKKIPFTLKSVALLYIVRSIFVTMTHLGPFPERSYLDPNDLLYSFNIGGDYFFSGHTSFPFLVALVFWENKRIRWIALGTSIIFGTSVILGHLHYSIDVFSAFFISYGVYHLAQKFFAKDFEIFHREEK